MPPSHPLILFVKRVKY